jgi:FKBP-type peptidyl-prolyl cis-trans isomerase FklB
MECLLMLKLKWVLLSSLIVSSSHAWAAENTTELKTEKDKLSYSIGASIGKNLKKEGTDIDPNLLIQGFKSGLAGEHLLLTDKEWRSVLNSYQTAMLTRAKSTKQQAMEANKKTGDAFMAENKTKKDIVVLPSGVQYKIIKTGDGKKPTDVDTVQVSYRGTLLNGTEFDATEPGHPIDLKISQLIAGWKEALKLMTTGSKWQLFIPPQSAYGERGAGNDIGPNETLIFELELIAIK